LSGRAAAGDWGALAALAAMLAVSVGTRSMSGRLIASRRPTLVPGIAALLVVAAVEVLRWALVGRSATDLSADVSGAAFGGALAQSRVASAACEGMARNPGAAGAIRAAMILGLVFVETLVLFTLAMIALKV